MLTLTLFTVFASLITLVILCFPPGYLAVSFFLSRNAIRIPFPVLVPLYLSVGLAMIMAIAYLAGTAFVSPLVLVIPPVIAVIGVLIWKRRLNEKLSVLKIMVEDKRSTILAVAVLATIFLYFAMIPGMMLWPPNGDAITHSAMTSLTVYQGHLPSDLNPIVPLPVTYPVGFHVFSADFSLLSDLYPSESIFIVATFFVILISAVLFTLSYSLTKSYLLSVPIAFTIVIAHSTGNLESYVAGYLVNGTFANLFGFGALLTVITLCQLSFQSSKSPLRILPLILVILISLFFAYPVFLTHAVLFFATYVIVYHLAARRAASSIIDGKAGAYVSNTQLSYQKMRRNISLEVSVSIAIVLVSLAVSYAGGLFPYYERIITSNTAYFSQNEGSFGILPILEAFASDIRFIGLIGITAAGAVIYMISLRPQPIFIGFLLIITVTIGGFLFISPQRTLAFLVMMSFPLIAYLVSEGNKTRIIPSRKMFSAATAAAFIVILSVLIVPNAINLQTKNPGWFPSTAPSFKADYGTSVWLAENVRDYELILTDRTFSSLFIHGFKILNISHNYSSGYYAPMPHELSSVWSDPGNVDNARQLMKKYDVKYVVLMNEPGFMDHAGWGGSGKYLGKPYSSEQYASFFNSYDFLELEYRNENALIYSVRLTDSP